ncbi:hypothetical protein L3X38_000713 [Prunus dulcis]|uniref:Uncharacterized protein n=1 Tax=Prunus dulcis TaxID=3755 RepID=A0AAD4ZJJ0_PRUDU|nr:hypothetical protein L3X38_000713 [Prunus dulcis]
MLLPGRLQPPAFVRSCLLLLCSSSQVFVDGSFRVRWLIFVLECVGGRMGILVFGRGRGFDETKKSSAWVISFYDHLGPSQRRTSMSLWKHLWKLRLLTRVVATWVMVAWRICSGALSNMAKETGLVRPPGGQP